MKWYISLKMGRPFQWLLLGGLALACRPAGDSGLQLADEASSSLLMLSVEGDRLIAAAHHEGQLLEVISLSSVQANSGTWRQAIDHQDRWVIELPAFHLQLQARNPTSAEVFQCQTIDGVVPGNEAGGLQCQQQGGSDPLARSPNDGSAPLPPDQVAAPGMQNPDYQDCPEIDGGGNDLNSQVGLNEAEVSAPCSPDPQLSQFPAAIGSIIPAAASVGGPEFGPE